VASSPSIAAIFRKLTGVNVSSELFDKRVITSARRSPRVIGDFPISGSVRRARAARRQSLRPRRPPSPRENVPFARSAGV